MPYNNGLLSLLGSALSVPSPGGPCLPILQRAQFPIDDLNTVAYARGCAVPLLLGHAKDDDFIRIHHSETVLAAYRRGPGRRRAPAKPEPLVSINTFGGVFAESGGPKKFCPQHPESLIDRFIAFPERISVSNEVFF